MKRFSFFVLLCGIAFLPISGSAAPAAQKAKAPVIPGAVRAALTASAALSPEFRISGRAEPLEAGTAFVARHPRTGALLLCTAFHLLGPAGGLGKQLTFAEARNRVREVNAIWKDRTLRANVFASRDAFASGEYDDLDVRRDFAAWLIAGSPKVPALRFAPRDAKPKERVYVAGFAGASGTPEILPGRVMGIGGEWGLSVNLDRETALSGLSGSSIVNARGEVVGIVIGGGERTILACPVSAIRKLLR